MSPQRLTAVCSGAIAGAAAMHTDDLRMRIVYALAFLVGIVAADVTIRARAGRQWAE